MLVDCRGIERSGGNEENLFLTDRNEKIAEVHHQVPMFVLLSRVSVGGIACCHQG